MAELNEEYLKDESKLCGFADQLTFAERKEEIEKLFSICAAVTAQGARTGVSGACVPCMGAVLNLSRMNGIIESGEDERGKFMDVLPGTTLEDIEKAAEKGYFFPPDPTEKTASIGGMLAVNASGPCGLYFGRTADHIDLVTVFSPAWGWMDVRRGEYVFSEQGTLTFPGGQTLEIPPSELPAQAVVRQLTPRPGTDLIDLFAGSEGMLGIFGRIRIRLRPVSSERWSLLSFFGQADEAVAFAEEVLRAAEQWCGTCLLADDFLDRSSLECYLNYADSLEQYRQIPPVPENMDAVMLELAGDTKDALWGTLEEILLLLEKFNARDEMTWAADSEQEREKIRLLRHAVPECLHRETERIRKETGVLSGWAMDVECKGASSAEIWSVIRECISVPRTVTIHVGRGVCHVDLLPETEEELSRADQCTERFYRSVLKMGGLMAAEHGIGKASDVPAYLSAEQEQIMKRVRTFFDPDRQCNTGNIWNEDYCLCKTGSRVFGSEDG